MMSTNKLRVLHVFANLNLGGAESRIMDLFRTQDRGNVINDFVIMTPDNCYFTDEVINAGGTIHVVPSPREGMFKNLLALYKLLKSGSRYDAVHSHTSYYSGLVVFAAYLAGIKSRVTHARNKTIGTNSLINRLLLKLGRVLMQLFATSRLAISSDAGVFLYGGSKASPRFKVVANAFDYKKMVFKGVDEEQRLSTLPCIIDNDKINLVMVARFYPVKNHLFVVKLMAHAKRSGIPLHLYLVGQGELQPNIQQQVEQADLTADVTFLGVRDDVDSILSLFDIMIMPSFSEGLGVAALEAQAAGIPCLLSDGIPMEVDLGVGLCQFLSLEQSDDDWLNYIVSLHKSTKPTQTQILEKFQKLGYDLESTRAKYYEAYQK